MKKLITEFIGTYFLVIAVTLCVLGGAGNLAPIGIGIILRSRSLCSFEANALHRMFLDIFSLNFWVRVRQL